AASLTLGRAVLMPPDWPLGAQVLLQLAFQHPARLDEQRLVDGLVRDPHARTHRVTLGEVTRDLLRRPVVGQLARHANAQLLVLGQQARAPPARAAPGSVVGIYRTIMPHTLVAFHLTTDARRRPLELTGDLPQGFTARQPPGDLLPLNQRQELRAALAPRWGDATVMPQDLEHRARR